MAGDTYRRRLRSRIIISFALFGFALTALFAISAIYLRGYRNLYAIYVELFPALRASLSKLSALTRPG